MLGGLLVTRCLVDTVKQENLAVYPTTAKLKLSGTGGSSVENF